MTRFKLVITILAVASFVFFGARKASAQSFAPDAAEARITLPSSMFTALSTPPVAAPATTSASDAAAAPAPAPVQSDFKAHSSPALKGGLLGLYVTTAVLQALDVHSTYQVIAHGGAEGNPMMAPIVSNKAAFVAVKAGIAAGTIMAARQLAKRSKLAAVIVMVGLNSAYAAVVSHNLKLAHDLR